MDQDKKQKILIAVLAVAALGAGGYFFFLREPANDAPALVDGPIVRKERTTTAAPTKTNERKERTATRAPTTEAPSFERKERAERTEDAVSGRRTRTKGPTEIKKSKKIVPAA